MYKVSQSKMCECCIFIEQKQHSSCLNASESLTPPLCHLLVRNRGVAQVCSKGRGQTGEFKSEEKHVLKAPGQRRSCQQLKQLRCNKFMVMWLLCLHIHHFRAFPPLLKEGVIHHTQLFSYYKCTLLRKWIFLKGGRNNDL